MLVAGLWLSGCKDKGDTGSGDEADADTDADTDTDTDADTDADVDADSDADTDADADADGYTFEDPQAVRDAVQAAGLPAVVGFGGIPIEDETCPAQGEAKGEETVTYAGGCTDANGLTWSGTMTVTEGASGALVVFDAFGWGDGASSVSLDGDLAREASGSGLVFSNESLTATLTGAAILDLYGPFPGAGRTLQASYSGYESSLSLGEGGASVALSGELTVADQDTWTVAAAIESDGICQPEGGDGGSLVLTGDDTLTVTFDGAASCEGCSPYETASGLSGSLCSAP